MNDEVKPKEYHLDSFKKLCNVATVENVDRLALDMMHWLVWYVHTIKATRDKFPKETNGKTNSQIAESCFTWIDDGKNNLDHVIMEDKATGETTKINFNKGENESTRQEEDTK